MVACLELQTENGTDLSWADEMAVHEVVLMAELRAATMDWKGAAKMDECWAAAMASLMESLTDRQKAGEKDKLRA
jgi:hypothetical protein